MIKPILLAATLAAITAHAGVNNLETCQTLGEVAEKTFKARYQNIPADQLFAIADGNTTVMKIIHEVYTKPRWRTEEKQQEALVDLKSKWVLWCMKTNEVIK